MVDMRLHWSELMRVLSIQLDDETTNKILYALNEAERVPVEKLDLSNYIRIDGDGGE